MVRASAVALALLLTACGGGEVESVRSAGEGAPTADATTSTSTTTADADFRLHEPFESPGYATGDRSLSSFRMDPAPAELTPRMSVNEVRRAAAQDFPSDSQPQIVRFGLYTGTTASEVGPDHVLTPSPVTREPAWVLLTTDVPMVSSGPVSAPTPIEEQRGFQLQFIRDADGKSVSGVTQTGGMPTPVIR